jgi:hydroxylaminobenzene mutase
MKNREGLLIFLGFLLFLLGLIVGLIAPFTANPRMGLSSHLEGIMNGMFLILLGLVWGKIRLSQRMLSLTFWLAIYGTFANWLGILIAAVFNGGKVLNIAAQGREGSPIVEGIINFSLLSLTLAMLFITVMVLIGLYRNMRYQS